MNPAGNQYYYPSQQMQGQYPQHGVSSTNYHGHPHTQGYSDHSHMSHNYPPYAQPNHTPPASSTSSPPIWIPNAFEVSLLDGWFRSIDVTGLGVIQGAQAVGFLKRSNLHRDTLRKIWSLVDTQNRGYIDKRQFALIMRLVSLSYAHPHVPVSMERYYQTCRDDHYPLPPMTGGSDGPIQQPHPAPGSPHSGNQHHSEQPMQPPISHHTSSPLALVSPTAPLSHTDRTLQRVPSTVEVSQTVIDDDAISEFSDFSSYSAAPGAPAMQSAAMMPNSQSLDDFEDMGDFQGPAVVTSSTEAPVDDDFDEFQTATPAAIAAAAAAAVASPHTTIQPSPGQTVSSGHTHHSLGHSTDHESDAAKQRKKSIEDMIASVAADPLNTRAPSLRQWQQEHHTDGVSTGHPHSEAPKEVDLLVLDNVEDSCSTVKLHKANAAMTAFDDMAELDLQASNEEWEDFADETTAPLSVPPPVEVAVSDNPFDQFVEAEASPGHVSNTTEDEDEGFGGFETAVSPHPVAVREEDNFRGTAADASPLCGEALQSAPDHNTAVDDDDFGDFAGHEGGGDSECAVPEVSSAAAAFVDEQSDDHFGDFSASSPAVASAAPDQEPSSAFDEKFEHTITTGLNGGDDDFGDFSASNIETVGNQPVASPVEIAPIDDKQELCSEDEFEGFETAPATSTSGGGSVDLLGDAFAELGDLMDAPALDGLSFTPQTSNAKAAPARQLSAEDLLDSVLLDSSLYSTPPAVTPNTAPDPPPTSPMAQDMSVNFLDAFMTPGASPSSSVAAQASQNILQQSSVASASNSAPSSFLLDLDSFSGSKQLPDVVDRSLTLDELETLFVVLMGLNLFPEAYGVSKQAEVVRKIRELGTKKMQAVESDDLELAIQLRDMINRVKECTVMASRDDEKYWLELAHSGKKKGGIEDAIELVTSIDPACSEMVRSKYIALAPDRAASDCDRALFYANACRSLQLAIAVRTSHTEHVGHWSSLLTKVSRVLLDSLGSVEEYKALCEKEQDAVKFSEQMNVFVRGLLRVVEVGKWVAASCQEAMVETAAAARTVSLCDSVIDAVSSCNLLDLESHYHVVSVQELSNSASRLVALRGRQEPRCCSLTLRPVSSQLCDDTSVNGVVAGTEMVDYLGLPYMQAAISLWVRHFPDKQPPSKPLAY